jgi:hypothetical protein
MALIKREESAPNNFTVPFPAGLFSSIPLRIFIPEGSYLPISMLMLTLSITVILSQNTGHTQNIPKESSKKMGTVLFLMGITMGLMVPTDAVQNIMPSI